MNGRRGVLRGSARALALILVLVLLPLLTRTAGAAGHHDIALTLDPAAGTLAGTARLMVEGPADIDLRLFDGARVDALTVDGAARPVVAALSVAAGQRAEVGVRWAGTPAAAAPLRINGDGVLLPEGTGWLPRTLPPPATWTLTASVPAPYVVTATGALVEESADHRRIVHRSHGDGALPSVFAGRWTVAGADHAGIRLRTYFPEAAAGLSPLYLERSARYLDRFAAAIGPYPYDGFHVVAAVEPIGIAVPGLTYVHERILGLPFMSGRSLAHEILHGWWGNAVAVDYASGNWAEGLTTYLADHGLAADDSADAARAMRFDWLRDFAALPRALDAPARQFVSRRHDAAQVVGYGKVAFFFHMLKSEIGAEAFAAALRRFYADHRFRVAGWAALQRAFEAESGRPLGWLFEPWLQRPGAPGLVLQAAEASRDDDGRYRVTVAIGQSDDMADDAADAPWPLAVPVAIATDAGVERTMIRLDGAAATTAVTVASPPRQVRIDPDLDVFRRLSPAEAPPVIRDVTLDPATVAVAATADAGAMAAIEALVAGLFGPGRTIHPGLPAGSPTGPLLIAGTGAELAAVLADLGVAVPADLAARPGTARAWVVRPEAGPAGGAAVLVVAAADGDALATAARLLPHYRRAGWVAFSEGRVAGQGASPPAGDPLARALTVD